MLLEHFYTLHSITPLDASTWCIVAALNPEHPLYQGHFPGHPVVPGVCMLQLIKECAEDIRRQSLQYAQIGSCKFLSAIDPTKNATLELTLKLGETADGQIQLLAEGKAGDDCFIKLKAQLIQHGAQLTQQ